MARRSAHSPEELRQLILAAAQSIIERDGLVGLSAREIARTIGYSPGTLYNIFENIDDVLLTLQTQMLARVIDVMNAVPKTSPPNQMIADLARALGLLVVAEGIENERQLARLSELGVASWQGFLKSGPVPGEQLLGLMA